MIKFTHRKRRMFSPLNLPLSIIITCGIRWFWVYFQNTFKPSITIWGTSYPHSDNKKAIAANTIVDSSYFFYSSEFDFNQYFLAIFPIKRSWYIVSASSCLLTITILCFPPSINIENYVLAVESVDSYTFLLVDE